MKLEEVGSYIVNWMKNYAIESKIKGFVIGISGGIDSALTSVLCAETQLPVLCVEIPIHQPQSHVNRAKEQICFLKERYPKVSSIEIDLTSTFIEFQNQIPTTDLSTHEISLANTRARLRMTTLYYFAGLNNYLVVGTGNKVEDFGVGFFTKYGDGGVDISPIADLLKSEVYQLAAYFKVPKVIQEALPADGLFENDRTDEEQLGASYDELEWAMQQDKLGGNPNSFSSREQTVFKLYKQKNTANKHKVEPIPICEIPVELKK